MNILLACSFYLSSHLYYISLPLNMLCSCLVFAYSLFLLDFLSYLLQLKKWTLVDTHTPEVGLVDGEEQHDASRAHGRGPAGEEDTHGGDTEHSDDGGQMGLG